MYLVDLDDSDLLKGVHRLQENKIIVYMATYDSKQEHAEFYQFLVYKDNRNTYTHDNKHKALYRKYIIDSTTVYT
mgnify:CR=1 FL=1